MSTLYELTGQYLELMEIADEADPDVLRDTLEAIEGEIEIKAENYAKVIKNLEGRVDILDKEIDRLKDRKSSVENSIKTIKNNLQKAMIAIDKKKFKTDLFSFNVQKNPPTVQVVDESAVPEQFWKPQAPVLNKEELKVYLKANGPTEYAYLAQGESLRIR